MLGPPGPRAPLLRPPPATCLCCPRSCPSLPAPSSGASTTPGSGQLTAPAAPVSQAVTPGGGKARWGLPEVPPEARLGAAQPGGRRWPAPARLGRRVSKMDLQNRLSGRKGILGRPEPSQGWNQTAFFEERSREK